jgi:hypothetical protein
MVLWIGRTVEKSQEEIRQYALGLQTAYTTKTTNATAGAVRGQLSPVPKANVPARSTGTGTGTGSLRTVVLLEADVNVLRAVEVPDLARRWYSPARQRTALCSSKSMRCGHAQQKGKQSRICSEMMLNKMRPFSISLYES